MVTGGPTHKTTAQRVAAVALATTPRRVNAWRNARETLYRCKTVEASFPQRSMLQTLIHRLSTDAPSTPQANQKTNYAEQEVAWEAFASPPKCEMASAL